jgi:hypothetical protein
VTAAARCTGMTGMQVTVVGHLNDCVRKGGFKAAAKFADRGRAHS